MKFTINRDTWAHGCNADGKNNTSTGGMLFTTSSVPRLGENAKLQCCLGHLATSCGYTGEDLAEISTPADVVERVRVLRGELFSRFPTGLVETDALSTTACRNTRSCIRLINANDERGMSGEERELKLTKLFKRLDIVVEFTGGEG